ncbi:MAG: response regulator, partial [Desulfobacteraceae bacterium]|nr:response regulator [Desulfobacteraceae bacterium]
MNPCRILIVEDESIIALDIAERLTGMGYEPVGHAGSGEQALELTKRDSPDLILMDIRLKGQMDGIATAHQIRRNYRVPVVFLTAYPEDFTMDSAKQTEPYGFILKPFEDSALKSAIEIALHKHSAEAEIRRLSQLYDLLSQVNQAVVRISSREELLATIPRLVVERGFVDFSWVGWLDPETSRIHPVGHFGQTSDLLSLAEFTLATHPAGKGHIGRAILEGNHQICEGCGKGECIYGCSGSSACFGFQSCAWFPLRFQGRVCGILALALRQQNFFSRRETSLLQEVAMDISFALDKIEEQAHRERTEAALRRSEKRLSLALNASRMGVWEWDLRNNAIFWSPECSEIITAEACDGRFESFLHCIHPEDAARVEKNARRTIDRRKSFSDEFRIMTPEGKVRWVSISGKAEYESDEPHLLIGTIENITDRRRAEEERNRVEAQLRQVQKMEALGTLAGGIAHDFNNILAIIMGYTEMVYLDAEENSEIRGQLWEVLQASARAKDLVKQILAFSRRNEQEKKPIQIGLIVKESLRMLRATLPSTIAIKKDVTSSAVVVADPTQMHQVLMNLCTNAAHAMQEGGGELSVSLTDIRFGPEHILLHPELQQGNYVRLIVKDTGHGISPAILNRI